MLRMLILLLIEFAWWFIYAVSLIGLLAGPPLAPANAEITAAGISAAFLLLLLLFPSAFPEA